MFKSEKRDSKRFKAQHAPKGVRYGIWTGSEHLRAGQNLTNTLATASVKKVRKNLEP